ncbi:MAG: type II toxin-antitoxin system RelE/ParE family toxin [Deltaproteobacteria bacterium]|nr:type II toxin-antitoxin system RelE/ParE family toxin [Deltaproteobacteria bacterium]
MSVRFTPEARDQAEASDIWWRTHRDEARDMFARELLAAQELVASTPSLGTFYTMLEETPVRRLLMPKTRHHIYYTLRREADEDEVVILAVWGAPKAEGPFL